jgi:hypothetical protein
LLQLAMNRDQLAGVGENRPRRAADHEEDDEGTADGDPLQRRDAAALIGDGGADMALGMVEHRVEYRACLVHEATSPVGLHLRHGLIAVAGAQVVDRPLQLGELGGQEHRQAIDLLRFLRIIAQSRPEIRDRPRDQTLGIEIRREIIGVIGQQEAALPGLGVDHQVTQINEGGSDRARSGEGLGIITGSIDKPVVHRNDRHQSRHADQNGCHGGADERQFGNRHQGTASCKTCGRIQWRVGKAKIHLAQSSLRELVSFHVASNSAGNKKPPGAPGATG